MHLTGSLKVLVLQIQIAIIRPHREIFRSFNDVATANNIRQARHCLDSLLRRCHAKVDVVLVHVNGNHRIRRGRIRNEERTVLVRKRAYLADRIQKTRARLVEGHIHISHIRIIFKRRFNNVEVRRSINRLLHLNKRHVIRREYIAGTLAIRTVVHNKRSLTLCKQRIQDNVNTNGS